MRRTSSFRIALSSLTLLTVLALLTMAACSPAENDPAAPETTDAVAETPAATPGTSSGSPTDLPDGDACGLLSAEAVAEHAVPATDAGNAEITTQDLLGAADVDDDSRSCTWMWGEGHRINLQVSVWNGDDESWGSRMVNARVNNHGFESVDGPGDEAAFHEDLSELFWRQGSYRIYSLSYGGPSPSHRLGLEPILAVADAVDG